MQSDQISKRCLFTNWSDLGRTAPMGVLAYATRVVLLRVSGKRTLPKMNASDFIVTVARGYPFLDQVKAVVPETDGKFTS